MKFLTDKEFMEKQTKQATGFTLACCRGQSFFPILASSPDSFFLAMNR